LDEEDSRVSGHVRVNIDISVRALAVSKAFPKGFQGELGLEIMVGTCCGKARLKQEKFCYCWGCYVQLS
jgi:hypothetical protein